MTTTDFETSFTVNHTPREVFNAINNVRGWWSAEVEGRTDTLNAVFLYHYRDVHVCKMKITEFVPGKKVEWLVLHNYFNFISDQSEWQNTTIHFDITEKDGRTTLHFTHEGLVPQYECFDICFEAWTRYIQQSLHNLITTGKGQPNAKEESNSFYNQLVKEWS
ncbi:SRPBCC family protein [Deminuibacter soli]|uniref:SRPBCC domain-containing protein n=1 Tax=Deminuibacter soli TaxID=2291815 RepID=A0A3E1NIT9_9BACT|nr:SRPBCC domain-containing protein [Deminuibacter soli]RFM27791.1 SRPBCC domain-containing protein [Deminuibacter soli]